MKLPLIVYPNPLLRSCSELISTVTQEIHQLALDMIDTMNQNDGVGLAAVQVGKLIRMFVCRKLIYKKNRWTSSREVSVYLNPKILKTSKEVIADTEGCLSIPGFLAHNIVRPQQIQVEFIRLDGSIGTEELYEMNARVFCHEYDHLNGVLYIDKITEPKAKKTVKQHLKQLLEIDRFIPEQ